MYPQGVNRFPPSPQAGGYLTIIRDVPSPFFLARAPPCVEARAGWRTELCWWTWMLSKLDHLKNKELSKDDYFLLSSPAPCHCFPSCHMYAVKIRAVKISKLRRRVSVSCTASVQFAVFFNVPTSELDLVKVVKEVGIYLWSFEFSTWYYCSYFFFFQH